ncbi:hypothetical protein SGFS_016300 [Streptomyces graminofaciens]|uniref:4'-phosphopantetheinyl transferase n=1 Tax=Streptomyces graminofaciens TaxID=68212 RepID=A0ABM7F3X1_9ACTN|nr:4'-phosphopantetheinyl transferase superfamily protein [Streptomyces graminofaciens]BBC30336.1 hypothetical protein SGFS_016300 [Streptomyces graminofaciens]
MTRTRLEVWLVRPRVPRPDDAPFALAELDHAERRQADRFVHPGDRLRYVSARIALRRVLARHTGTAPGRLRFRRASCTRCGGPHGRPELASYPPPVRFSLSHSHGLVVIAVAATAVGADVRRSPGGGTVEACLPALHPTERAELEGLPESARPNAFVRLWTRKEAYLKGTGAGLVHGAAADYLGAGAPGRPPGWTVIDLDLAGDRAYAAAVAVRSEKIGSVELRECSASFLSEEAPAE